MKKFLLVFPVFIVCAAVAAAMAVSHVVAARRVCYAGGAVSVGFVNASFEKYELYGKRAADNAVSVALKDDKTRDEITANDLINAALESPEVHGAAAYVYGDTAVIAVKCGAVFFRSENLAICGGIKKRVSDMGFREVYVTKDIDVYTAIAEAEKKYNAKKNEKDYAAMKESVLKKVKEREGASGC
ncbi:MAG: YhcN/YlaJ family sporulation lipoprotein [Clostridiales bacterium]|jgi:hypothetical protein|nr:YhcN/YlaJ family sporulation lipoprotein [Clostridiales bacterium]